MLKSITNFNYHELEEEIIKLGFPKFRTKQIWHWVYNQKITNFEEMNNIPQQLINVLKENYKLVALEETLILKSKDGTKKSLLKLEDEEIIETVLMKYKHGYTVCVTSQVGCRIGCSFCASHRGGFIRNLNAGEIVGQIQYWNNMLKDNNEHVSNIVVMGIGEPFDNLDEVLKFIDIVNDKDGYNIGARKITVSTSGILDKMDQFMNYDKQINLAVSLHAPFNETRSQIMKINKKYNVEDIIKAVTKYQEKTNRQVTFEYILLDNINDSIKDAEKLAEICSGLNIHINLIPYNSVDESDYKTAKAEKINKFASKLENLGISVTVRRENGSDIDGACGQLRNKKVQR